MTGLRFLICSYGGLEVPAQWVLQKVKHRHLFFVHAHAILTIGIPGWTPHLPLHGRHMLGCRHSCTRLHSQPYVYTGSSSGYISVGTDPGCLQISNSGLYVPSSVSSRRVCTKAATTLSRAGSCLASFKSVPVPGTPRLWSRVLSEVCSHMPSVVSTEGLAVPTGRTSSSSKAHSVSHSAVSEL